jgi:eukaryotic-like serine/threonine-protein kinase
VSIAAGSRIGPYEILSALGAGGMGEVYRARDSRLGREVAIKVLPDTFARDPERMARFGREAQLLASLNHPHIASVYGVEETNGVRALVMELVDGPTLAERIAAGPIPVDEALPLARQMTDALEAAHDRGVIHRDLKPANIKLTAGGQVKVLDFGLAKAVEPSHGSGELAHSPTMSVGTQAGLVLGTAAYMSPEQARGRPTDRRTDIWGFGCVLFEMLTGRPTFGGESVTDLIAAIVKEDPDWAALPADTPPAIRHLLRRCLKRDQKQRLHDIGDARLEIEEAIANPGSSAHAASAGVRRGDRRLLVGLAAAAVLFLGIAGVLAWRITRPVAALPIIHFTINTAAGLELAPAGFPVVALSPDERRIAYTAARDGGESQIYVRLLDSAAVTALAGTERADKPFFSPDGRWIAFTADNKLKKVSVDGGQPVTLCDAEWGGGWWGADDSIVFTPHYTSGLWKVRASGGTPEKLTDPDTSKGELGHWWPQLLPDGRHVLFTAFSTPLERSRIVVYAIESRTQRVVAEGAVFGRYAASGHLLMARAESIVALPFDPVRAETVGAEVPVLDDVGRYLTNGVAQFGVSPNGMLAFVPRSEQDVNSELVWLDRKGNATPALTLRRRISEARLSPDNRRLALTIEDDNRDLWTYDFDRGVLGRVTFGAASDFGARWTPDGRRVFFASEKPVFHVYGKPAVGTAPDEPFVAGAYDTVPYAVSPDGRFLVYRESHPKTRDDLWLLPLSGDRKPKPLVNGQFDEYGGDISPDGRWLAYTSEESGRPEVFVQPFPEATDRWQISSGGGQSARWSPDGRELMYAALNPTRLVAVAVRPGSEFAAGAPSTVHVGRLLDYDIARDGRVLLVRRDSQAPPPSIHIVLNWFEELRAKFRAQ